jgi:hypothetical protein
MENIDIPVIRTITGQVRHRRKLLKTLFFIDIQPVDGSEKSQIFIRSDDNSQSEYAVQDAFKACRPGNVVKIQVGHALNPKEGAGRGYQVWQSNKPVQVMTPFALREPFLQDPPLASKLDGSKVEKSKINCKYWLNQQYCARGEQCKKGHPTGEAFERARADWLEEVKFMNRNNH